MMNSEEQILRELKLREKMLLEQLATVRRSIESFGGVERIDAYASIENASDFGRSDPIIDDFDPYATYDEKILWALRKIGKPAYVKQIVDILKANGEQAELLSLNKRITYNASNLFRKGILEADKRQKQYRYSVKRSAFTFSIEQ